MNDLLGHKRDVVEERKGLVEPAETTQKQDSDEHNSQRDRTPFSEHNQITSCNGQNEHREKERQQDEQ